MKATCLFLIVLTLSGTQEALGQETAWAWQNPLPQGNTLHAVHFADASMGWLVGSYGEVLHTTNGGATWTPQTSGSHDTFWDIVYVDSSFSIAVGPEDYAYYTMDGGQTRAYSFYEATGAPASKNTRTRWEAASAPSGVYVYRLQTERRVETRAMTLLR